MKNCPRCQSAVEDAAPTFAPAPGRRRGWVLAVVIVLLICLVGGGGGLAWWLTRRSRSVPPARGTPSLAVTSAAASGDVASLTRLLEQGGDLNAADAEGLTPLHHAVAAGQPEAVRLLLERGARVPERDELGRSLADLAALSEDAATFAAVLRQVGKEQAGAVDGAGRSALHRAALAQDGQMLAQALAQGMDVRQADGQGLTALHLAAMHGNTAAIEVLLQHGAAVNALSAGGRTPLHLAALGGHAQAVALLVLRGADARAVDRQNLTALHMAAAAGDTASVRLLLAADAGVKDTAAPTPRDLAIDAGHWDVVDQLE